MFTVSNGRYRNALIYEHFEEHKDPIPVLTDGSKSQDKVGFAAVFPHLTIKKKTA